MKSLEMLLKFTTSNAASPVGLAALEAVQLVSVQITLRA